jgi:hypothetical protein
MSAVGVHQGDPCGPLGFALGLDTALDQCLPRALAWESWYLDEGLIVGKLPEVLAKLEDLQQRFESIGLQLSLSKCQLWGPGFPFSQDGQPMLPPEVPSDHPSRAIPIIPFGGARGVTVLGVPVDAPKVLREDPSAAPQCVTKWRQALEQTQLLLQRLRLYPECQVRLTLLQYCLDACRVVHLLRSTELEEAGPHPALLRAGLQEAVQDLLALGVSEEKWEQVCLPTRLGGLGISDPIVVQPAARLAALLNLQRRGSERVGVPKEALATPAPDLQATLTRLQAQVGPNMDPLAQWMDGTISLATATEPHTTQKWWAEQVSEAQSRRHDAKGSVRDRTRLACQKGPVATGWLRALPNRALHTDIPDCEMRLLLRWWLGLAILPEGKTLPGCPLCNDALDPYGDHFVCCERNGSTRRHNAFRDAFFAMCAGQGVAVQKEVECHNKKRPADILLVQWSRGQNVAIDFVCTHPAGVAQHPLVVDNTTKHCNRAETRKVQADGPSCEAQGWGFSPFAISTWGGLGSSAKSVLFEVTKRITADLQGWPKTQVLEDIRRGLSVTLMREIARQLSAKGQVEDATSPF